MRDIFVALLITCILRAHKRTRMYVCTPTRVCSRANGRAPRSAGRRGRGGKGGSMESGIIANVDRLKESREEEILYLTYVTSDRGVSCLRPRTRRGRARALPPSHRRAPLLPLARSRAATALRARPSSSPTNVIVRLDSVPHTLLVETLSLKIPPYSSSVSSLARLINRRSLVIVIIVGRAEPRGRARREFRMHNLCCINCM